jgi:Ca2+-binding EF-hand superfamily protein
MRMQELEEKALEVRWKRQLEQLEENVRTRQELEGRLLESEHRFREEQKARKEAEVGRTHGCKALNETTNRRLKAERTVSDLQHAEEANRGTATAITDLRAEIESLGVELERNRAVAREKTFALVNFDESNSYLRAVELERLEMQHRLDEHLRALGLQIVCLKEQVKASDQATERDSAVIQGLLHDGTRIMNSAHEEVQQRKIDLKQIDDKLVGLLKSLEIGQEASHLLHSSFINTTRMLDEVRENDRRDYKYMHRRLTQPYLREELVYKEIPMTIKPPTASSLPPLTAAKPTWTERAKAPPDVSVSTGRHSGDLGEQHATEVHIEADTTVSKALDAACYMVVPGDPLEIQPDYPILTGTFSEALAPPLTDGEVLVSQSLLLIKGLQEKQAASSVRFNTQANRYTRSLSQLDKDLKRHQRQLDDAESGKVRFSDWNESIPPGLGEETFPKGKPKSHVQGKSIQELFHYYDQDGNGFVNKGELMCILNDVGLLRGLDASGASKAVDEAWLNLDENGDGAIGYSEFATFIKSLDTVTARPSRPVPIPDDFHDGASDKVWQVYLRHCSKKYPQEMGWPQFVRALHRADMIDTKCSATAACFIFARARKELEKRVRFPEFLRALALVATLRGSNFTTITDHFVRKAVWERGSAGNAVVEAAPTAGVIWGAGVHDRAAVNPSIAKNILNVTTMDESIQPPGSQVERSEPCLAAPAPRLSLSGMNTQKGLRALLSMHDVSKTSAAVEQLVLGVALTPGPKNLVSDSGERMSVREIYNKYDRNRNGTLEKSELTRLIIDLELVRDLSKDDTATIIDSYFQHADINGDQRIDFQEFAVFYHDLVGVRRAGTSNLAVAVPKKYKTNAEFKALFLEHCCFGKGNQKLDELDGTAFLRCFKNADVLDERFNSTVLDIVFSKSKERSKRKMKYNEFLNALAQVCGYKSCEFDELSEILMMAGPPKTVPRVSTSSTPRKRVGGQNFMSSLPARR